MSDNWITLIPTNPLFIPTPEQQAAGRVLFEQIAPDADEIELIEYGAPEFFDCGGNFETASCPNCAAKLDDDWWPQRLDDDYQDGFKLASFETPCCGAQVTMNDVIYQWTQGIARFGLSAMNPNLGLLDAEDLMRFEKRLGTTLRVIYQHI